MNPLGTEQITPSHPWARLMLFVMGGSIVVAAFFLQTDSIGGSVRVLVRDATGARTVQTFDLQSARMTEVPDVDPYTVTTDSVRIFRESDGSIITLNNLGIIRRAGGSDGALSVLIASPVPPRLRTPFAIWGGGSHIAWVSPTDGSVQVFSKNTSGAYSPVVLYTDTNVNSLGFSDQGNTIVLATLGSDTTTIRAIPLSGGDGVTSTLSGLITIIPTP